MSLFESRLKQAFAVTISETEQAVLTASGESEFAEQIIAVAREHGVPVKSEPDLVDLLANVPPGEELPEELLLAVSEVIAFLYKLENEGDEKENAGPPGEHH